MLYVGSKVRLLKSIWDDGEDHHPPGWLAMAGEVLVVRSVGNIDAARIAVSHEGVEDSAFMISRDEFETYNDQAKWREHSERPA